MCLLRSLPPDLRLSVLICGVHRVTLHFMKRKKSPQSRMEGQLVLRLPVELRSALDEAAARDRRKVSDYVRIVLEDHLTRMKKRRK